MSDFFSNQISEAPNLDVLEHLFLMIIWFFMLHLCFRCYQKRWFRIVFWWLQFIQIVSLYTWYADCLFEKRKQTNEFAYIEKIRLEISFSSLIFSF